MATFLVADSKIDTGAVPFLPVRQDSPTPAAELREQMRQLVPEGALDFGRMFAQPRIERKQFVVEIGAAGAGR